MKPEGGSTVRLLGFLSRSSPNRVFASILLGSLAGIAYALLISLVTQAIQLPDAAALPAVEQQQFQLFGFEISNTRYAVAFFLLCGLILIARTASAVLLQWVAINASWELRLNLYDRISQLPVIDLERIGPSRLNAALANDVPAIVSGAGAYPAILTNVATIAGLLGFLAYLDGHVFAFNLLTILVGVATYRLPLYFSYRFYHRARGRLDNIQEGVRGLIYGAKELKLNRAKHQAFLESELVEQEREYRKYSRAAILFLMAALNYGNLVSFLAIGVTTFVVGNHYGIGPETLVGVVMAMLYITGPLGAIMSSVGPVVQGTVALKKLTGLLEEMPVEARSSCEQSVEVRQVELRNVQLCYGGQGGGSKFNLGPIDLTLRRGEINFIVGGNGSGKSTLGKVLSLHYIPQHGSILFNGHLITQENRDQWRQNISAIYADFYLFPKLYGVAAQDVSQLAHGYLEKLQLDQKVSIRDGYFSTISLSEGQKKRLALLMMYLEKRDVYVFDEWAADQDPQFKEIFYSQILTELKQSGKLIVVISHDDRYYHLADNIIRMEDGCMVSAAPPSGQLARASC